MDISKLLADVNNFVWGPVMLVLLVGTGIFLTVRLKFLPGATWATRCAWSFPSGISIRAISRRSSH